MAEISKFTAFATPTTDLVDATNNTNLYDILCPRDNCRCLVLRKGAATLVKRDPIKPLDESDVPSTNEHFWHVGDMMDFDNVGFSKTVGDTKFLSCADCDVGPLGYHNIAHQPKEYLISIDCARYRPRN
ncbi:hypothetical protein K450DRAFT_250408 [Umbelopsis ramanniana AG]|uniref:Mss4-like protein n=1 Tax=Umbelopsis ramanniana AG TaxID=1314678 RepID=A0AAD5E8Q8_UMBRA|nr:uncharacterized protein K450DRAFT_250408 [Umbelopsis ramanniana AG]KAI8577690.1 hypothetical protein K450DRAFT_250408 [Umbelopsis ramanniana AG]